MKNTTLLEVFRTLRTINDFKDMFGINKKSYITIDIDGEHIGDFITIEKLNTIIYKKYGDGLFNQIDNIILHPKTYGSNVLISEIDCLISMSPITYRKYIMYVRFYWG